MTVAIESIKAYNKIKDELGTRQKEVYDALEHLGKANSREIAEEMNKPINSVTPRVFELRKMGFVMNYGSAYIDPVTDRQTKRWMITPPERISEQRTRDMDSISHIMKIGDIEVLEPISEGSYDRRRYNLSNSDNSEFIIVLHGVQEEIGMSGEEIANYIRTRLEEEDR